LGRIAVAEQLQRGPLRNDLVRQGDRLGQRCERFHLEDVQPAVEIARFNEPAAEGTRERPVLAAIRAFHFRDRVHSSQQGQLVKSWSCSFLAS
jgi:hypothetical protein